MKPTRGLSRQFFQALLPVAVLALVSAACNGLGIAITGSGTPVTKTYDFSGFTGIAAGSAFRVELTQGAAFHVEVTTDDNVAEQLRVEKSGSTLQLHLDPNLSLRNVTLNARVTMPELSELRLSGATDTTLAGFKSDKPLMVELSGASRLKGDVVAGEATLEVSGASQAHLTGRSRKLSVSASGAGQADCSEFDSGDTRADASGASQIRVKPSGTFDGEASGAATIRYGGNPTQVESRSSGAASVKKQ
jgi:hypothetical protein